MYICVFVYVLLVYLTLLAHLFRGVWWLRSRLVLVLIVSVASGDQIIVQLNQLTCLL